MEKKKLVRLTSTITALALSLTLTSGCGYKKRDKFYFSYSLKGEAYIHKNDYISSDYINNYYLIEVYHIGLKKNILYIAHDFKYTDGTSKYTNIFNNYTITYNPDNNDNYEFLNVMPLIDIIKKYNLEKEKYYYKDIQYIYEVIKENYTYNIYTPKTKIKIK